MVVLDTLDSATCLVVCEGKVLLLLRDNKPDIAFPNTWALAGGFLHQNETPENGVRRELLEEVGYVPENLDYLGSRLKANQGHSYYFISFVSAEDVTHFCLGNEGQAFRFFNLEELGQIEKSGLIERIYQKNKDLLAQVLTGLKISSEIFNGI